MAVTNVSFEMNDKLKNQMEEICEDLGMSMDDAFQIFARKMVNEEGLPFEVTEAD
ncbi:type II toxin-antitoxin system RelB/DinJ family antitoxin, partial [Ileibacterium valens]